LRFDSAGKLQRTIVFNEADSEVVTCFVTRGQAPSR
jgi:hypothetical protein